MKLSTTPARALLLVMTITVIDRFYSVHSFVVAWHSSTLQLSKIKASQCQPAFQWHLYADTDASSSVTTSTGSSTVTILENSAVAIAIPVPGTATKAAYDKVCHELSKQLQIPGFRKGSKIPPQVLEQSMSVKGGRNALKVQAITTLVKQLVEPAIKEQALDPIGQPTLTISAEEMAETFVPGEPLTLQVQCDIWPEIQWKGGAGSKAYIGLKGTYTRKPFNEAKLQLAIRDLKERYVVLEPVADPLTYTLAMGDACTVNMVGYMATADGQKGPLLPNAASGDRVEVVLGLGRYMEGLVESLVGAKVGETVTVSVNFPEKLRDKTLAGKQAIFDVEIVDASKRILPDLTDEFAAKVRVGLTKDTLLTELKKAIDAEDSKEFVPERNAALGKALAEVMDVNVPDTLVTNQARERFAMMMSEMRDGGVSDEVIKNQINPENFRKYKDIVKDEIEREFKISMATDEIARLEGIDVPDYQVEEQMEAIRKDAAESEEFDENMIRAKVQTTLQRQAVMDWLADKSELEVKFAEDEEIFDEKLLEELAEQSLQREGVVSQVDVVDSEVEEPLTDAAAVETVELAVESTEDDERTEPIVSRPSIEETSEMTLEEKAFQALLASGAVELHKSPDDPDYDHSADNEEAPAIIKE